MDIKKILIGVGVVGVGIFIYTKMRKKKQESAEPKVEPQKTLLTSEQVDKAIKEEPKKKEEVIKATEVFKGEAPMPPMMPKEDKPVAQIQKLPPPITETKVVEGIKPKVILEFESPMVKNVFASTPRPMSGLSQMVNSAIQMATKSGVSVGTPIVSTSTPKPMSPIVKATQSAMEIATKGNQNVGIVASTPLTKFAPRPLSVGGMD